MATQSYFLRPHFVFFSLGAIVFIHLIASVMTSPAFVQLILNSLACVYVGCMANSKIRVNKGIHHYNILEANRLEKVATTEGDEKMTQKDAAMFPVYLSGYLFGLYLLFKVLDKVFL